jgi:hypothetical protein
MICFWSPARMNFEITQKNYFPLNIHVYNVLAVRKGADRLKRWAVTFV